MSNLISAEMLQVFGVDITDDALQEFRNEFDRIDRLEHAANRNTPVNLRAVGGECIRRAQQSTDQEGEYND